MDVIYVYVGGVQSFRSARFEDGRVVRTVTRIVCHPDFNPTNFLNDLCLLKLSEPVNNPTITLNIGPNYSLEDEKCVCAELVVCKCMCVFCVSRASSRPLAAPPLCDGP